MRWRQKPAPRPDDDTIDFQHGPIRQRLAAAIEREPVFGRGIRADRAKFGSDSAVA